MHNEPNTIHGRLLYAIKGRLPQNHIAGKLMDLLCIGKEAVYRRLRGEVYFSLEEVATIALEFGISIDDIIVSSNHPNNRTFQYKTTEFVDLSEDDYYQMEEWVQVLKNIVQSPTLEVGEAGNALDHVFIYSHIHLCHFYHFRWKYQHKGFGAVKHFKEIGIAERHRNLQLQHMELSKQVKKTCYVWDYMIFQYIVNDIIYFRDICLLDKDDVENIKKDLKCLLDDLELIAERGCYETGNAVQLYISELNANETYSYYQCESFNLAMVKTFTLSALSSLNMQTTNEIRDLILSQKRQATLISASGEMQRIKFFRKQREILEAI